MNADAAATGDITDHGIARHRLAALRITNHQPVDALDLHTLRATNPIHQSLERAGLRGIGTRVEVGVEELQNLQNSHVTLTNRCQQMRRVGEIDAAGRAIQGIVTNLWKTPPLELTLQNVLT